MLRIEWLENRVVFALLLVLSLGLGPGLSGAQTEFESLLAQRAVTCLLEVDGVVLGGLDGGGLLIWDDDDLTNVRQYRSGPTMVGNIITDMAYSGQYVWVATDDGGLARIGDVGGNPTFRPYGSNIGSMDITAVTGTVIGTAERVYYAMDGAGLGVITEGLPGGVYTAEQDGLLDDNINDLIFHEGDLYIATPTGVCRFVDNSFVTINGGLGDLQVRTLAVDAAGQLFCGGDGGVYRWNEETTSWSSLAWGQGPAYQLSTNADGLWGLSRNGDGHLGLYTDGAWSYRDLPRTGVRSLFAGQSVWAGGVLRPENIAGGSNNGSAWFARHDGGEDWTTRVQESSLVYSAHGMALEDDGSTWVGSLVGNGFSGITPEGNHHFFELASVANDSVGLYNPYSNFLDIVVDSSGVVMASQFTAGLIRFDPETDQLDLIHRGNSALSGARILKMLVHPDGPIIMMRDYDDGQKIQILLDPQHWRNPASWLDLPQSELGVTEGVGVFDAAIERRDVIWFMVEGQGPVRWDTNGLIAGPEDDLTWDDFGDDIFNGPMGEVTGTSNDLTLGQALEMAADGTLWVGGDGVTRVSYDGNGGLSLNEHYSAKTASFDQGLINGLVSDMARDRNGDLWVLSAGGLNRIVWDASSPQIDAFFNFSIYFNSQTYSQLYSTNAVTELPNAPYFYLETSPDRSRLALSSNTGAVTWSVPARVTGETGDLAGVYFYPQPFMPDQNEGRLKMAGVPADAINSDGALVEVYNLEGQLVYRNSQVSEADGFWDGRNRVGNPVATGMYFLKLTWRNQVTTRSLAVVR